MAGSLLGSLDSVIADSKNVYVSTRFVRHISGQIRTKAKHVLHSVAPVFDGEFQLVDFFQIEGLAYVFWNRDNATSPYFPTAFHLIYSLPYRFRIDDGIGSLTGYDPGDRRFVLPTHHSMTLSAR